LPLAIYAEKEYNIMLAICLYFSHFKGVYIEKNVDSIF